MTDNHEADTSQGMDSNPTIDLRALIGNNEKVLRELAAVKKQQEEMELAAAKLRQKSRQLLTL